MESTAVLVIKQVITTVLISIGVIVVYLSLVFIIVACLRKNGERYKEIE